MSLLYIVNHKGRLTGAKKRRKISKTTETRKVNELKTNTMQAQDFIKDFKGKGVILTKEGYKKAKIAIASNGGIRPTADKIGMYFETVSKLNNEQVVAFDSWKRLFDALIEQASKSAA